MLIKYKFTIIIAVIMITDFLSYLYYKDIVFAKLEAPLFAVLFAAYIIELTNDLDNGKKYY